MFLRDFARIICRGLKATHCQNVYCKKYIHNTRSYFSKLKAQNQRELELRYIYVRACVDFWADMPVGVMFDTAYLDSRSGYDGDNVPVLLGLHHSPGSSLDLIPLLQPFANLGYRVIIPDFPGFGLSRGVGKYDEVTFTGGTDERIDFLHNFLHNIGITRVDLLVAHGSGCNSAVCYAASTLHKYNIIRSIALINPVGHRPSSPPDYASVQEFAKYWDEQPLLKIPLSLALIQATYTKLPFLKKYSFKERIKVMIHLAGYHYDLIGSDTSTLGFTSIPRLMVYSRDNESVNEEIMKEYADYLGIPSSNFGHFDSQGKLQQPEINNPALKGMVVEKGSEQIIQKYTGQLTVLLHDLLKHSLKRKSIV